MRPTADLLELASPLSVGGKLRLSGEVLATYCQVRWWMRGQRIDDIVARLREGRRHEPSPGTKEPGDELIAQRLGALRLGRAVSRTVRLLPTDSRCLVQSLVLTRLLGRRGVPSALVIGVMSEPQFAAHAWVEHGGAPLLPPGTGFERLVEV
ncbi:MAG: lasso peptide biosynthesis B2 protein [Actinomycetota bacterium]|nr:lasso peptide biosynthesis B2 protein [Actinomycetota bacterium]